MPKALGIHINWEFTGGAGITQVEHTVDCFGGAWLKSLLSTEVWHPRHIWRNTAFQFAEVLALNGETLCCQRKWINFRPRVTGRSLEYKLNRTRTRTEPLGRRLRWGLQELVSLPMCTLKRRSRSANNNVYNRTLRHAMTKKWRYFRKAASAFSGWIGQRDSLWIEQAQVS